MAKMIKFDLPIDGVKVATLDDLQDHFTTEIVGHFRSNLLARWLRSRGWTRELVAVEALATGDDATTLKELCRIFEIEADDDAIAAAVAEVTGVPGIRPDRMRKKQTWNPGDTFQDCPGCPKLVVVPSGSFMMGSPEEEEDRDDDEGPTHEVRIGYQLAVGVYPVTFDEWDACVSDGGCGGYEPEDRDWGRGTRPVINVSWEDAKRYVGWLSWKTGKGYRLLSESEWEYVARAGTGTSYWWGNEIGRNRANCRGCGNRWDDEKTSSATVGSIGAAGVSVFAGVSFFDLYSKRGNVTKTSPVGSFSANAFGLYDVHGNVDEWVEDCWNDDYAEAPTDGSAWESGGCDRRVLRGGAWWSQPSFLRSANRSNPIGGIRSDDLRAYAYGFRVARTLTP